MPEGIYPFAKNHQKGERFTRSAVCTSSPLRSLRPRLRRGRVSARRGWAGETGGLFEHPEGNLFRRASSHDLIALP